MKPWKIAGLIVLCVLLSAGSSLFVARLVPPVVIAPRKCPRCGREVPGGRGDVFVGDANGREVFRGCPECLVETLDKAHVASVRS